MSRAPQLVFRADASPAIGSGHLLRCLAIAEAWHDLGGRSRFVCSPDSAAWFPRLSREGCEITELDAPRTSPADAAATAELAAEARALVIDGYDFGPDFRAGVRGRYPLVLLDDDGTLGPYAVDVVLNPSAPAAPPRGYDGAGEVWCGPEYRLLRREFRTLGDREARGNGEPCRIGVLFGGSDPTQETERAIATLTDWVPEAEIEVFVGRGNPRREALTSAARSGPVTVQVDADPIAPHLLRLDLAISAAGGTAWELAALGVPTVLIAVAANQRTTLDALVAAGAAWEWQPHDAEFRSRFRSLTARGDVRRSLSEAARRISDSNGAVRVAEALWNREVSRNPSSRRR